MNEIYANINIDFDGKVLNIAEESSSGCSYNVTNEQDLFDYILGYVMDIVDETFEYDFKVFKKER